MTKIHLAKVKVLTGLPLPGLEEPIQHPTDKNSRAVYADITTWFDWNNCNAGEVFSCFEVTDYNKTTHKLAGGLSYIDGPYNMTSRGYVLKTFMGWEWIRDVYGEIFTGQPYELKNHHPV